MGDIGDFWRDVKAARRAAGLPARGSSRRPATPLSKVDKKRLEGFGLKQRSEWHWQMSLGGDLLNFWPSKCKWQWRGEVKTENWSVLFDLIREQTPGVPPHA